MMPLLIRGVAHSAAAAESLARLDEVGFARGLRTARANCRGESSSGWCWPGRWWARPSVLLADEPTGNLDFRTGEMIFDLLAGLHRSHRLTSVLVTHNLSFARRCDRIFTLEKGGLVPDSINRFATGSRVGVSLRLGGHREFYV